MKAQDTPAGRCNNRPLQRPSDRKSGHWASTPLKGVLLLALLPFAFSFGTLPSSNYSDWTGPLNVGPIVNSQFDDYLADISKDGLSLYFTSTRPGFGGDDIWVSQRASQDDAWGIPMNIGPLINSTLDERTPSLSRDGHFLFFVTDRTGFGSYDIWVSRRDHVHDNFIWGPPMNLGAGVNSSFNDVGPSFFQNDEDSTISLYFSSNRPGGFGQFDIYASRLGVDGSFGPAELVQELSSPQVELRPTIRHDGLETFFNSGPAGNNNGRDLWTSKRDTVNDPWSTPTSLGTLVNSGVEDSFPALSADGLVLLFNSNRAHPNASGGLDLYFTTRVKIRPGQVP
jgi:hypothetical protein